MSKVLLHIGAPKTGSSFLQKWLGTNRDVLRQHRVNAVVGIPAHRIAVEYIDPRITSRRDVAAIYDRISLSDALDELDPVRLNVISSEYFFHARPQLLSIFFANEQFDVASFVCFLRRQDVLLASGYAQEVKANGSSRRPLTHVGYNPDVDWSKLFLDWRHAFPLASAHFYDYDAVKHHLLATFQSTLPPVSATNDAEETINESLNVEMVEIARVLNERGITFTAQELVAIQRPGPPFSFSQEITSAFEATYLESNRKLDQLLPGHFTDYAKAEWIAGGADMTGVVPDARVREVVEQLAQQK